MLVEGILLLVAGCGDGAPRTSVVEGTLLKRIDKREREGEMGRRNVEEGKTSS